MEFKNQRDNNTKRKTEGEDAFNPKKRNVISCFEVLSEDNFISCMKELGENVNSGFARVSSEFFDIQAKLSTLEENVKSLQKAMKVKSGQRDDLTPKKDLKGTFDKLDSTDSLIEIVSVTPCKESTEKKVNNKNRKKAYCLFLDKYDPFSIADPSKAEWLDSWMTIDRYASVDLGTINADKNFCSELTVPQIWLSEDHIDVGMSLLRKKLAKVPCPFRSERLVFLDVPFTMLISKNYQTFLENLRSFSWSSGFMDYYNGVLPKCERTNKRFGADVDDVYVVLNIKSVHWIALAISILHRHIEVYDNIISLSTDDEIEEFVKPYALMFPHLIKSLAFPAGQHASSADRYTITRCKNIPQNKQLGDCGVYALKYIECLALDKEMENGLCDANIKDIRKKLATDMFVEANHFTNL